MNDTLASRLAGHDRGTDSAVGVANSRNGTTTPTSFLLYRRGFTEETMRKILATLVGVMATATVYLVRRTTRTASTAHGAGDITKRPTRLSPSVDRARFRLAAYLAPRSN